MDPGFDQIKRLQDVLDTLGPTISPIHSFLEFAHISRIEKVSARVLAD